MTLCLVHLLLIVSCRAFRFAVVFVLCTSYRLASAADLLLISSVLLVAACLLAARHSILVGSMLGRGAVPVPQRMSLLPA